MNIIDVTGESGHDTTFTIDPPLSREGQAAEPLLTHSDITRGSEQILLVDDSPIIRRMAKRILERCGYTVVDFADGCAALPYAADAAQHVDLLLTDVVMPGMSGLELASQFRVAHPDARTLVMSGYPEHSIISEGSESAELEYLAKPFTADGLALRVRQVLDRTPI